MPSEDGDLRAFRNSESQERRAISRRLEKYVKERGGRGQGLSIAPMSLSQVPPHQFKSNVGEPFHKSHITDYLPEGERTRFLGLLVDVYQSAVITQP